MGKNIISVIAFARIQFITTLKLFDNDIKKIKYISKELSKNFKKKLAQLFIKDLEILTKIYKFKKGRLNFKLKFFD